MSLRFSSMLMPYLALYLLSRFFNLLQGYFSHLSEQNLFFLIVGQILMTHFLLHSPQPRQTFFSRRKALQMPQFMPQGAISDVFISSLPI